MSSMAAAWKPWATNTSCAARSNWSRRALLGRRDVRRLFTAAGDGGCMTEPMLPAGSPTALRAAGDYLRMDVRVPPPPGRTRGRPARRFLRHALAAVDGIAAAVAGEGDPRPRGSGLIRSTPWTGPVDGSDGPRERALYV